MQHPDIQLLDEQEQLSKRRAVVMIQIGRAGDADVMHDDPHLFHHLCLSLMMLLMHIGRAVHLIPKRLQDAHIASFELIEKAAHIRHDQYPLHLDPSTMFIHRLVWLFTHGLCRQDEFLEMRQETG